MATGTITSLHESTFPHGYPVQIHASHDNRTSREARHQKSQAQTDSMTFSPLPPAQIPHHKEAEGTQTYNCAEHSDRKTKHLPDCYRDNFDWAEFNRLDGDQESDQDLDFTEYVEDDYTPLVN